ncbi:ghilanten-like [Biomphalaria glabrata]|uniref:Ghilanten-like n=1 Tax=Biomphalaria glabrata TaxID=6526 RepID=A0A9W2ZJG3_BIOGL|nr:ghilanten-like [Biomphalaria glabrata]KAI8766552.1 antistasin isoform X2 [Biomphalaria glabrata]
MNTLWLVVSFALLTVVSPAQFGICVEQCSPSFILSAVRALGCPSGQACMSNGCGHTCQPILERRANCPFVACGLYCQFGFRVVDGCTLCSCNPNPFIDLIG